jgi:hypothetical protein
MRERKDIIGKIEEDVNKNTVDINIIKYDLFSFLICHNNYSEYSLYFQLWFLHDYRH